MMASVAEGDTPVQSRMVRWRAGIRTRPAPMLVAIGVALVALNILDMVVSMDRDEGAFLTIARQILYGSVPYRDVFDQKSPGIFYLLAGVLALTRGAAPIAQLYVARLLVVGANVLTAAGLFSLGRSWRTLRVGLLAAALFLFVAPLFGGAQLFTEPFATCCVVWSLACAARKRGPRSALLAGLLLALGMLFKQTALLALPGVVMALMAREARPHTGARAQRVVTSWQAVARSAMQAHAANVAALVAGVALPWLLVCGAFAVGGGFSSLVNQVVLSNLARYPADPGATRVGLLISALAEAPLIWLSALWAIAAALLPRLLRRKETGSRLGGLGAAFAVTGVLSLIPLVSHAYLHYFMSSLPWATLLTADALSGRFARWREAREGRGEQNQARGVGRALARLFVAALAAISFVVPLAVAGSLPTKYAALNRQRNAAQLIARVAGPNGRLLILPAEPEYYFLSGSRPVTPYVYLLPINATDQQLATLQDHLRSETFDVVAWQVGRDDLDQQPGFPALYATLKAHYHLVTVDHTIRLELYRRNP